MEKHIINHSFKEYILVPYVAITNNVYIDKGDLSLTTDGVLCTIKDINLVHICSSTAERIIKAIYNLDPWSFLKRWNQNLEVSSTTFLYLHLERVEKKDM